MAAPRNIQKTPPAVCRQRRRQESKRCHWVQLLTISYCIIFASIKVLMPLMCCACHVCRFTAAWLSLTNNEAMKDTPHKHASSSHAVVVEFGGTRIILPCLAPLWMFFFHFLYLFGIVSKRFLDGDFSVFLPDSSPRLLQKESKS